MVPTRRDQTQVEGDSHDDENGKKTTQPDAVKSDGYDERE